MKRAKALFAGVKGRSFRRMITPYLFLAGALIFMLATIAYPFVDTIRLAFYQYNPTRPDLGVKFIWFENFREVLTSASFWTTFLRTVAWTLISVSAKLLISLVLAFLLYQPFRGRRIYQMLVLVPWITPAVVAAVTWKWIYNGQAGVLNYLLVKLHIISEPRSWLGEPTAAFFSVVTVDVWFGIPLMTILLIAGLQAISPELLDAAKVDGANFWTQTRHVTLPLLLPVIAIASTLSIIWTFNSFQVIWPLTRGGPINATEILVIRTYREFFGSFEIGIGATYAVISLCILLVVSAVYLRLLNRGDES